MIDNQVVRVAVNEYIEVWGSIALTDNEKRISVTMEMRDSQGNTLQGFHKLMTEYFTLRKNGSWVRRGVMMGRGWNIKSTLSTSSSKSK